MNWSDVKDGVKKTWHFLYHDDSLASWIVNIVLAFVIIKFLVYPGIGLVLGTNLPIVAVISESMEHDGSFDTWWMSPAQCESAQGTIYNCKQEDWYTLRGITKSEFEEFHFKNGFNKGDVILLRGISYDDVTVGTVIVFESNLQYPVIHRVVDKNDVLETKGDHNFRQIEDVKLNEKYITKDEIIGRAWIRIPYVGYVKILAVNALYCVTFNGCHFG